jgi:hypothetical protein
MAHFEGVCAPDGHSQAPRDGFMASLKMGHMVLSGCHKTFAEQLT